MVDAVRLALMSDIHGNDVALDAVLEDIEARGGVDEVWVLGDLTPIGPNPLKVLDRLHTLARIRCTVGNGDRYVTTGARPAPTVEEVQRDPRLAPVLAEIAGNFAWTQGYLAATGWLEWLDTLPLQTRTTLPDGTRVLGVHAAPGKDDGAGLHRGLSDDELYALVGECQADLVIVGHTHVPMDRTVGGIRVVNLGSVSLPVTDDARAGYAVLEATSVGYRLERRRAAYDRAAVAEAVMRLRHPAAEYIASFMRGERRSPWAGAENEDR